MLAQLVLDFLKTTAEKGSDYALNQASYEALFQAGPVSDSPGIYQSCPYTADGTRYHTIGISDLVTPGTNSSMIILYPHPILTAVQDLCITISLPRIIVPHYYLTSTSHINIPYQHIILVPGSMNIADTDEGVVLVRESSFLAARRNSAGVVGPEALFGRFKISGKEFNYEIMIRDHGMMIRDHVMI